jgi:nitronate monooxygenase
MLATRFTELVGCTAPIQQAPMGAIASPELAAAVSEAGGLGMVGTSRPHIGSRALADLVACLSARTSRPFGVNFVFAPAARARIGTQEQLEMVSLAARTARLIDFSYSQPDCRLIAAVHAEGALACWQVGSREEAVAAVEAGSDLVAAQGTEAGGRIGGTVGLLALLDEVLDAVDVPVLAAGGIGTARAMAAALAAGADGVRIGTRFLGAEEADAHPEYVEALMAARPCDTIYTTAFSRYWNIPQRVLRSSVLAAEAFEGSVVGEQMTVDGTWCRIRRFGPVAVTRSTRGSIEAMMLSAGESVGGVHRVQPAGEIVRELVSGACRLLHRWC